MNPATNRARWFKRRGELLGVVLLSSLLATGCAPEAYEGPPNIVLLFADDLGYGDLGAYGARGYETPNLDQLAADGIRLTSFYVPVAACTASRAALMTGSYPERIGFQSAMGPRSTVGLNPDEWTVAELLKGQGYATAAVGKWHLGDHPVFLPTNHGFDSYFGLPYSNDMSPDPDNNPRRRARRHPPLPLIRDTLIVEREPDQTMLTRRYTDEAVAFIESRADRPFFLYLAYSFPHVPLHASDSFRGTTQRGLFGDVLEEIDWSVGEVLAALDRRGLSDRTLVLFTSDNGPWLVMGDHAGSTAGLREGKATSFEGGHRMPAIARWPGRIPAGTTSDALATTMDILPTVARLAGSSMPDSVKIDGYDIWPILAGQSAALSPYERFFYYSAGQLQAVRSGRWKLHVPHAYATLVGGRAGAGGMPGEYATAQIELSLFDLEADPGETRSVADQNPEVVARLLGLVEEGRRDLGDRLTGVEGSGVRPRGRVNAPWSEQVTGGGG